MPPPQGQVHSGAFVRRQLGPNRYTQRRCPDPTTLTFALRDNPDVTVAIWAESREEARARLDGLNQLAESFGLSGQAAVEFLGGRDSGDSLKALGQ
jgi:hypothetical protein